MIEIAVTDVAGDTILVVVAEAQALVLAVEVEVKDIAYSVVVDTVAVPKVTQRGAAAAVLGDTLETIGLVDELLEGLHLKATYNLQGTAVY